jgi:hypothetical protein
MDRRAFQDLARLRLKEAKILLTAKCYEGAYYLGGYVIECGMKACIAKRTERHSYPPPRKFIEQCYTHNITELLKAANLEAHLATDISMDSQLRSYWATVKDWSEQSRYDRKNEPEARDLLVAVSDPKHGVLKWLKSHW